DDARIVEARPRGDLPDQDHQARLHRGLQRHATRLVLAQAFVQHRVGDLVADLVRMTFGDGFGGEECVAKLHRVSSDPAHAGVERKAAQNRPDAAACQTGSAPPSETSCGNRLCISSITYRSISSW